MSETSTTVSSITRLGGIFAASSLAALGSANAAVMGAPAGEWLAGDEVQTVILRPCDVNAGTQAQITKVRFGIAREDQPPRTSLGARLLALRSQAVEKGMSLMNWEEIDVEVRSRRGEREGGD